MRAAIAVMLALGLAGAGLAHADVYSTTDADGVIHFTNKNSFELNSTCAYPGQAFGVAARNWRAF